jgi:hypothetical protein
MNRIRLVLFDMNNRIFGPYLAQEREARLGLLQQQAAAAAACLAALEESADALRRGVASVVGQMDSASVAGAAAGDARAGAESVRPLPLGEPGVCPSATEDGAPDPGGGGHRAHLVDGQTDLLQQLGAMEQQTNALLEVR